MCTSPRYKVTRFASRYEKLDTYPCGKCPECLLRKQAEFACMAVLQAKAAKSVYLVTLTYKPSALPIMEHVPGDKNDPKFVDSDYARFAVSYRDGTAMCCFDGLKDYCPSLRRKDVQLAIKSTREAFRAKYGFLPEFKYAGFGEYG